MAVASTTLGLVPVPLASHLVAVAAASPASNYDQAVVADNPISFWELGETSGTTAVDQEGRTNGAISGGVTLGVPGPIPGQTAMALDGGNCTGIGLDSGAYTLDPQHLSISAWVKTTAPSGWVFRWRYYGYELTTGGPGNTVLGLAPAGAAVPFSLADGQWHNLIATYDESQIKLYVDGLLAATGADSSGIYYLAGGGVAIGRDGDACDGVNPSFKGSLADVAVYGSALSAADVQAQYLAAGLSGPLGGPISAAEDPGDGNPSEPHCTCTQANVGAPVNTATGNFWHTISDLVVPGRGLALDLRQTYDSQNASINGPLGYGWSFSYGMSLLASSSGALTLNQGNGSQVVFTPNGSGGFSAPPRVVATLVEHPDASYTLTRGSGVSFNFDPSGRLVSEVDLNGYITALAYSPSDPQELATVTDPGGRALSFAYNSAGQVASVTDPAGRSVSFSYDPAGDLSGITGVNGGITSFTYDGDHHMLSLLDPDQAGAPSPHPLINAYDAQGRVSTQTDAMGRVTTFDYSSVPGSTKVTQAGGDTTLYTYLGGELVSKTAGYGTARAAIWRYSYDPVSLGVTSITDPDGHTSTATYDAAGNLLTATDALENESAYTYNALHEVLTATDPARTTTTFTYDARGNPTSVSTPLAGSAQSQTTTYTYGDPSRSGDITSVTDPDAKVWSYTYDAYGDLASSTDPMGDETTYSYTCSGGAPAGCFSGIGLRYAMVAPKGNGPGRDASAFTTTYAYDAAGELTRLVDPLGHVTASAYDANGNRTSRTDASHNTTNYTYDLDNELAKVTTAAGTPLRTPTTPRGTGPATPTPTAMPAPMPTATRPCPMPQPRPPTLTGGPPPTPTTGPATA